MVVLQKFRKRNCRSSGNETGNEVHVKLLQNKGSDKRGWSFRRKSAEQRALSNTVVTEISSSVLKSSEPVIINSEAPIASSVSEKPSANKCTEELPRVSTSIAKSTAPSNLVIQAADEDEVKFDSSYDESSVIFIQASVRRYLAQRELVRHKKAVKLQAAVRGHLVRCHAAGSLRCIQAILKMQARVRARYDNKSVEKTSTGKEGVTKPHPTYISIEKLLSNRFANQLLESTPRTKQINIKCNPTNDDTTYKWLERWTSVSSPQVMESHTLKPQPNKPIDTKKQSENMISGQKPDSLSNESNHSNTRLKVGPTSSPWKHSLEDDQPKRPAKRAATEPADFEGRKSAFGSRKASNPAFISAQSRFEELTVKNKSLTSVGSSNQEHVVKSPGESLVYESLKVGQSQTVDSECGTELSVTSMLDSPDTSEVGNVESEKEAKVLDKEHALVNTELTRSILDPSEKHDCNTDVSQVKQSPEDDAELTQSTQIHHHQVDKASPEPPPRSHVTAHGSPSSEMSNNNKNKTDRTTSGQKSKSWSKSTKSPVSSGLRTSLDNLPQERKPGRRRNSFGSQSSDQEPRDSSSNNYIPSYMQVTESARAKALANNSPRSSPDVQVKEGYMKKRHSMPGAVNGRHDSPGVKRTSPQAQLSTKGNNNPERKWQN
ncbi:protein IQ-DOMAIN 32-like [Bidens hawaiensis]|uniref:protein IQ-DOMAIN 32-like n=1 Tax=Bidens hawaiensis TaxID=980011 RepID=UPI00404A550A